MKEINLFNYKGEKTGEIFLEDKNKKNKKVSEVKKIVSLINFHYLKNKKQETRKVKNRSEVAASTKKILRQKGTGGARHGAKTAPQFVGGGVAFGPRGIKSENLKINKKMKNLSLMLILEKKLERNEIIIIDEINLESIKTKKANEILENLLNNIKIELKNKIKKNKKKLLVLSNEENEKEKIKKSFRNINQLNIAENKNLNPFFLISNRWIIFTKKAFDERTKNLQIN